MAGILTSVRRILRSGFVAFWRNGFVTLASILVMTVTLFVLGSLIFLDAMLDSTIAQIREKVDVNVYLTLEANEQDALDLQAQLEELPEVASVEYVSEEKALERFQARHADEELILQALDELEENPLGAQLNIQATETSEYENIANFIEEQREETGIIDRVNFFENREAIERLTQITHSIERLSAIVLLVFAIISILIVFNTVRLAIYTARNEIQVMKLVGASNTYIRGPFVVEGVLYGIASALIAIVLFYPITLAIGPFTESFFGGANIFDYYVDNFEQIFVILVLAGAGLGALSSFLAVKKYLKV